MPLSPAAQSRHHLRAQQHRQGQATLRGRGDRLRACLALAGSRAMEQSALSRWS